MNKPPAKNSRFFPKKPFKRPSRVDSSASWVFGRRPVQELLESGLKVLEVLLLRTGEGESYHQIRGDAEARGIKALFADRFEFDRRFPGARHQGVAASFESGPSTGLMELFEDAKASGTPVIFLDEIEDPHNVGAVMRSAEVFGAAGVVIPKRRSAEVTPTVIKVSAGAALRIKTASVGNLADSIRRAKDAGLWIYGLDMSGSASLFDWKPGTPCGIVLGSEGHGVGHLVKGLCDQLVRIPQVGSVGSLNVSAAGAVVLAKLLEVRSKIASSR